jgi:hypothetical protein
MGERKTCMEKFQTGGMKQQNAKNPEANSKFFLGNK